MYGPGPLAQVDGGHVKEMVNYIYVYTIIFRSHLGYCKPAAALRRPLRRPYCGPTTAVQPGAGPGPGPGPGTRDPVARALGPGSAWAYYGPTEIQV